MAKGRDVAEKPRAMKLAKAADLAAESLGETPSYMAFPREHWRRIRTNNPLERIMKEIRRRTRVVGALPDGRSALRWVAAGLRDIAGTRWGTRRYMDMGRLREEESDMRMSQAGQVGRPFLPPGEGKAVEGGVTPRSF
jgi:transposase-like protein